MNTFKVTFIFECKRRLCSRDIIIFFIIAVIFFFSAHHGKNKYLNTTASIKVFQEAERAKVHQYLLYRQYGAFGIQLLFVPSPYSTLFNDYAFNELHASVNIAERLNIYKSVKGQGFFIARSGFMTFCGIILLFGVFAALLYGYDATKSKEYLKLLSSISGSKKVFWAVMLSRVIILNLVFLVLIGLPLLSLLIDDINLFQPPLVFIVMVIFLLLTFFFVLGGVIGSLKKLTRGVVFGAVYFLSVGLIPFLADIGGEINAAAMAPLLNFDLNNIRTIMEIDRELINQHGSLKSTDPVDPGIVKAVKDAVKNEHQIINQREVRRKTEMLAKIRQQQTVSLFFPVLLYISTNKEISSHGGLSLVDFYSFGLQRKREFLDFYVKKRFPNQDDKDNSKKKPDKIGPVENFVKTDEDLFYARSHLPNGFSWGVFITLFYISVLSIILYRIHVKITKKKFKTPKVDFDTAKTLFALCRDEQIKGDIFQFFKDQKNTAYIDKITVDFQFYGIRAPAVLKFFCGLAAVKKEKLVENLAFVGIDHLSTQKLSAEEILKFYAVVKISGEGSDYIILDDFFKNSTRQFEEDFLKLLTTLEAAGKKILYLSCEMYYPKESLKRKIKIENFTLFPLPFDKVTLR
jgi:hypothetical protein